MTKRQLPNQQAVANMILSNNISNSNNLNKFWVGIFKGQSIKFTKRELGSQLVSQLVSQLLTSIANDRTRVR